MSTIRYRCIDTILGDWDGTATEKDILDCLSPQHRWPEAPKPSEISRTWHVEQDGTIKHYLVYSGIEFAKED